MTRWLLVVLIGCQRTEPPSAVGSAAPAPLTTSVIGCAAAAEVPRPGSWRTKPSGWFPYARRAETPGEVASPIATKANLALTEKLSDLDLCLTGKTGSLSIMLDVATTGAIEVRAGGIGDRAAEQCVAKIAAVLELGRPAQPVELDCVLAVNAAGPFRVTTDGGYRLVELTADAVTLDGKPIDLKAAPPALDTTLVIAPPDAEADRLSQVLAWVAGALAVLVAVRADGGPPVYVAMLDHRIDRKLAVDVDDQQLRACAGSHRGAASLLEPHKIDAMLREAVAACGESCPEIASVGVGGKHVAKQLVGATSALRRAGHDPVLTIGSRCAR